MARKASRKSSNGKPEAEAGSPPCVMPCDAVLPRLLSGELRVKMAEKLVVPTAVV